MICNGLQSGYFKHYPIPVGHTDLTKKLNYYSLLYSVQYAVGKFRLTSATFMSRNAGVDNHLAISLSRTTSYENYPRALRSSRRISSASRRIRPANRRIAAVAGGPPSAASGPLLCHRPACRHATPPPPPPSRPRLS